MSLAFVSLVLWHQGVLFCHLFSWSLCREYENLKEARKASGELADKLKKDLATSKSKVTEWEQKGKETWLLVCCGHLCLLS